MTLDAVFQIQEHGSKKWQSFYKIKVILTYG